jgi:hypothetical protein
MQYLKRLGDSSPFFLHSEHFLFGTIETWKTTPKTWVILLVTDMGLIIFLLINRLIFVTLPTATPSCGI